MATRDITAEEFNDTITDNDIVLVDFWASWCGPCKQFAPTFAASSEEHPDVVYAKVDTEAEQQLAAAADIRSIPTLMAFKKGKLVFNQAGAIITGRRSLWPNTSTEPGRAPAVREDWRTRRAP